MNCSTKDEWSVDDYETGVDKKKVASFEYNVLAYCPVSDQANRFTN